VAKVRREPAPAPALILITGLSGSGKGSVLKVLEDLGYYSVDNLPIELLPKFAELVQRSPEISRAALVVDIREGLALERLPSMVRALRKKLPISLLFLEASNESLQRRFSETRRPHPLGTADTVRENILAERLALAPIQRLADLTVDTSKFNVHELRRFIQDRFSGAEKRAAMLVAITSFGYRHGVPADSDLVFDVRFLPNPNYIPAFKELTGRDPKVARYIQSFPQTREFIQRISDLLIYLIPHYAQEGKSYLTISFGCTGGHHRSVMIADSIKRKLAEAGYHVKVSHRDARK
jgi:RNase adapter protein RapZ